MKIASYLIAGTALVALPCAVAAQDLTAEVSTSWTSGGEMRAADVIREAFEARGGTWQNTSIAGFESANAAFQNRVMAGDPPTVRQFVLGQDAAEYAANGMMTPITDIATAGNWAEVLPAAIHANISFDGEVYLAPTGLHGESWMYYSRAAFEAAGITAEPQDWDAFFADMDALQAAGLIPIAWGGQSWQEAKVFYMVLLTQVGIEGFNRIFTGHDPDAIGSDGVRAALEIFGRMRDYVDAGAPGRNWNDATAMVITGQAGVQFMGDWAKGEFTGAGQEPEVDFGCMLVPSTPGMVFITDGLGFPATRNDAGLAAQKLMAEVVIDPAVQVGFSLNKGSIPVRTDVDTSGFDACAQKGIAMLEQDALVPDPAITVSPEQVGLIADFVGEFFATPDADIDAAMADFAAIFE